MSWQRTVLMGNPAQFSVKGGANPHTRTWLGTRRSVDRARAIEEWQRLRDALRDHGLRVVVVPADPGQPGLVYPANAGFLLPLDAQKPRFEKTFYLSNLIATRAGERQHYDRVVRSAGFRTACVPEHLRFEGEADFFAAGDVHLRTHGALEDQLRSAYGHPAVEARLRLSHRRARRTVPGTARRATPGAARRTRARSALPR